MSFQKAHDSSHPLDDPTHVGSARTSAVHASLSRIHLSKSGTDLRQYLEETSKPPGCPGQVLLRSSESPSDRLAFAWAPRREAPYKTPRIPLSTTLLPALRRRLRLALGGWFAIRTRGSHRPAMRGPGDDCGGGVGSPVLQGPGWDPVIDDRLHRRRPVQRHRRRPRSRQREGRSRG